MNVTATGSLIAFGLLGCAVDELDENEIVSAETVATADGEMIDETIDDPSACTPGEFSHGPYLGGTYGIWAEVTIPAECTKIEVKIWGDGGGPGNFRTKTGGGGGYTYALLQNDHPSGTRTLQLKIGGSPGLGQGTDNVYSARDHYGGHGSYVYWLVPGEFPRIVAVAGGGGAGGIDDFGSGGRGGAGGGQPGLATNNGLGGAFCALEGGGGGSSGAPGAGGVASPGVSGQAGLGPKLMYSNGGIPGSLLNSGSAGSGGAGYQGGGGGAYCHLGYQAGGRLGSGGGGGGSFVSGGGATLVGGRIMQGNYEIPANSGDPDRCQFSQCVAGNGGTPSGATHGYAGRIVVRWR